ncbi:wnt inhibitory factor 1-like [Crassostrea angulata]|uniref:wnt inhibitory factor 1-like n=1 Tax=Magallana angulata TaxID=2784310 RepID=UPI0022B0BBCD|nr:wnt inhibitory factor 1-like [Crassostrea angulata]
MKGLSRYLVFFLICFSLFRETGSSGDSCRRNSDCGANAFCNDRSDCDCETGFYDFSPLTTALSDGCLGNCGELGRTNQCEGNTQCILTPQGYGECTCPENTFGPPECRGDCKSSLQCSFNGNCEGGKCVCFPEFEGKYCDVKTSMKPTRNLYLLLGAAALPLILLVPAAFVSSVSSG